MERHATPNVLGALQAGLLCVEEAHNHGYAARPQVHLFQNWGGQYSRVYHKQQCEQC